MPPAAHPARGRSQTLRGMACMVLCTLCVVVMQALVRHLSARYHAFELVFFRYFAGLLFVLPWFLRQGLTPLRTPRVGLHMIRAAINVLVTVGFFTALGLRPLAEVTSLSFLSPIFVTLLAMAFLSEAVGLPRWTAILFGFAGTYVVLRPGFQDIAPGSLIVVAASFGWAVTLLIMKAQSRTELPITITSWTVVLVSPLALVPSLFVWRWPGLSDFALLMLAGTVGTFSQFLLAQALKDAETQSVMPLDFLKLVWAVALGYLVFADVPDLYTIVGGAMIFASATSIAVREGREAGAGGKPATPPTQGA